MRRNLSLSLTAIWLLVFCGQLSAGRAAAGADDAGKTKLELRLRAGDTYKMRMTIDQKISQTIGGRTIDMNQTMGMGFACAVQQVDGQGNATLKVTYDSIVFKQDGPIGKTEYDSAKPPATVPAAAKGLAALLGQGFTITVTPAGHVTKVEGVEAVVERMLKQLDLPEGPSKVALQKKFKSEFGDQAMKGMMEQMMAIYPDKPVAVGDSWQQKVVASGGFPIILRNTWTLKSRKGGVALLEVKSKIESNPDAKPMDMGVMSIKYQLSGDQEGTTELDEATGWTLRGKLVQKLAGKLQLQGAPAGMKDTSWPISCESVVRYDKP